MYKIRNGLYIIKFIFLDKIDYILNKKRFIYIRKNCLLYINYTYIQIIVFLFSCINSLQRNNNKFIILNMFNKHIK